MDHDASRSDALFLSRYLCNQLVTKVNGEAVSGLSHLVQLVQLHRDQKFLTFDLEPHSELVVLETAKLAEATTELLANHQIPHDRSADLRAQPAANGTAGASTAGKSSHDNSGATPPQRSACPRPSPLTLNLTLNLTPAGTSSSSREPRASRKR